MSQPSAGFLTLKQYSSLEYADSADGDEQQALAQDCLDLVSVVELENNQASGRRPDAF